MKVILGFLAGCILTGAIFYFTVIPKVNQVEHTQDQGLSALQQQNAAQLKQIQTLQEQIQSVTTQKGSLQEQIQSVTTEKDSCQNKFNRGTYLYETGVLSGPTHRWWIPVDVEPVYLGQTSGTYSHYDPKTQTETVHFQPKTQ